jgi:hypothetical protein
MSTEKNKSSSVNYGFLAFCSLFVWCCTYFILMVNNIGSGLFCNVIFGIIFCSLLLVHAYNCGILKENKKNNSYCYMNSINSMH